MVNEIPMNMFLVMNVVTIGLIIFSFIYEVSLFRIIASFISMILAYVNSFLIINGNVVMVQTDGAVYSFIPITNTTFNYFWLFIAILMGILTLLFIIDEINYIMQTELNESIAAKEADL